MVLAPSAFDMKLLERVVFAAGLIAFVVLLWTMDAAAVGRLVLDVGWGIALIVAQEVVAHVLNAAGWRLAFPADQAAAFRFRDLLKLRVVGDAVNYLTPSATIAGEFTRAAMLSEVPGTNVRVAAVLVAKCTQTLAQVLFVMIGLVLVAGAHLPFVRSYESLVYWLAVAVAVALLAVACHELWIALPPDPGTERGPTSMGPRALARWLRYFFRIHPGRFSASTALFMLGYAWGGFEAYWICHFLGIPVSMGTAMTIEVLSVTLDSILFMVPAKVGIQEGGKTAIFAALGLPPTSGLAFGLVRHLRELIWAGSGLLLYSVSRRPAMLVR